MYPGKFPQTVICQEYKSTFLVLTILWSEASSFIHSNIAPVMAEKFYYAVILTFEKALEKYFTNPKD